MCTPNGNAWYNTSMANNYTVFFYSNLIHSMSRRKLDSEHRFLAKKMFKANAPVQYFVSKLTCGSRLAGCLLETGDTVP